MGSRFCLVFTNCCLLGILPKQQTLCLEKDILDFLGDSSQFNLVFIIKDDLRGKSEQSQSFIVQVMLVLSFRFWSSLHFWIWGAQPVQAMQIFQNLKSEPLLVSGISNTGYSTCAHTLVWLPLALIYSFIGSCQTFLLQQKCG